MSEQRQLCLLCLDALASLVEILLVEFKADEVPTLLDASDGGRTAAHTVVEHRVALVGVGENEPTNQRDRLLRRMKAVGVFGELQDVAEILLAFWQIERPFVLFLDNKSIIDRLQFLIRLVPIHLV